MDTQRLREIRNSEGKSQQWSESPYFCLINWNDFLGLLIKVIWRYIYFDCFFQTSSWINYSFLQIYKAMDQNSEYSWYLDNINRDFHIFVFGKIINWLLENV